nr:putative polyprotein [Tanacetum cinerariifolium]
YFPSTTEKYFSKLPPILSQRVHEAFKKKYPGLIAGVLPAIKFTHTFVSEMCKEAALKGEGEFQSGIAIGKEEFMFMVYEEGYEYEDDEEEEEEVAFMPEVGDHIRSYQEKAGVVYMNGRKTQSHGIITTNQESCGRGGARNRSHKERSRGPGGNQTKSLKGGVSSCFINKEVVPKEALELLTYSINVNGLNSQQPAKHKIRAGTFAIEGNKFRIPLIYAFDMKINDGIKMLIGTNFIRAMQGGIRIEGDEIMIYKKVTKFKTTNQAEITQVAIDELEMDELEYQATTKKVAFHQEVGSEFRKQFKPVIEDLKEQGYIGEEPLKHWKKNGDKSRHRTMAMMVNSGTSVDPLPDLSIPPEEAYIILEVDGCMEGWGGVVKWKPKKEDLRNEEKICAYASGKFTNIQSTIDAEISACINTLEKLKIYYLDKQEITLRTDCQAIISFYKKTGSSKASRVRWMKFADAVTGTGVKIEIEHIEGKHNVLADSLSRLVNSCVTACTAKEKEQQVKMITRAAAVAVDKVLTMKDAWENEGNSHGTSLKKEQEISKQISQISNHCLQTLQKLFRPMNQQGNTRESKEKPIHT